MISRFVTGGRRGRGIRGVREEEEKGGKERLKQRYDGKDRERRGGGSRSEKAKKIKGR